MAFSSSCRLENPIKVQSIHTAHKSILIHICTRANARKPDLTFKRIRPRFIIIIPSNQNNNIAYILYIWK